MEDFDKGIKYILELAKTNQDNKFPPFCECHENKKLKSLYLKYKDIKSPTKATID